MVDDARAEASWPAPYASLNGSGLYIWYVKELGAPAQSLGVYTTEPPHTEGGLIKSIRIAPDDADLPVILRGVVVGARYATRVRDYLDAHLPG